SVEIFPSHVNSIDRACLSIKLIVISPKLTDTGRLSIKISTSFLKLIDSTSLLIEVPELSSKLINRARLSIKPLTYSTNSTDSMSQSKFPHLSQTRLIHHPIFYNINNYFKIDLTFNN